MSFPVSRRKFLAGLGALAGASVAPSLRSYALFEPTVYGPMDLSYFDTPISAAPTKIQFGYASITWDGNDRQAIEDIAALGFHGIQLRSNVVKEFSSPSELRDLLQKHQLTLAALSSGGLSVDSADKDEIAKHVGNAKFVHDVGGLYLQVIDQKPKDREVTSADYKKLGRLLTEIGKRTADLGISLGYHNHMGTMSEHPEGLDRAMEASDSRYAKLELDV